MAGTGDISRGARRLIADHVDSAGALDLLLLMHADASRGWSAEELCRQLRCPAGWAHRELERMRQAGLLIASDDGYHYLEHSPHTAAVDELAHAWRRDRRRITRLIFAPSRQFAG